jgi:hypothetical protein
MKKTLLTLALASTLFLGNGCEERKPQKIYTSNEGNSKITLKDYSHLFCMEIETPESKKAIYAEKYQLDDKKAHLTQVIIYTPNSTSKYSRISEKGRSVLKDSQPEFDKYFEAMQPKRATNTQKRINRGIESSSFFKQLE